MRFGKIRIENGELIYIRHMMPNSLPVRDILWAYVHEITTADLSEKLVMSTELVIFTRRRKEYRFEMSHREAASCILLLKALHPEMAVGYPQGNRIPLDNLSNTRDIGALKTIDDRFIIPGKLIRSGDLYHISANDQRVLREEYQVRKVIDLRSRKEARRRPDTILAGAEYYHIPIFDEEMWKAVPMFGDIEEALRPDVIWTEEQLAEIYEDMVTDSYSVKQFARFVDIILKEDHGAVLWHGSTGKDRTGIATAILLTILGVPRDTIIADYIRSNTCMEEDMKHMFRLLESVPENTRIPEQNLEFYYRVQENCLRRAFRKIDLTYGSMYQFLRKGLYLTPKAIETIKERYLL